MILKPLGTRLEIVMVSLFFNHVSEMKMMSAFFSMINSFISEALLLHDRAFRYKAFNVFDSSTSILLQLIWIRLFIFTVLELDIKLQKSGAFDEKSCWG